MSCGGGGGGKTVVNQPPPPPPTVIWIELSPSPVVVAPTKYARVKAVVHNHSNQGVTWSTNFGSFIEQSENECLFIGTGYPGSGQLTATSVADTSIKTSIKCEVFREKKIDVTPTSTVLNPGQEFKFTVSANYTPANIGWTYEPTTMRSLRHDGNYGEIKPDGTFCAPWVPGTFTINAQDPDQFDALLGPVLSPPVSIRVPAFGPFTTRKVPVNEKVWSSSQTALNSDEILIAGGVFGQKWAIIYNLLDNTCSQPIPMMSIRHQHMAVKLPNGRIWLVGGSENGSVIRTTEFFDPGTRSFSWGPELPQNLMNHQVIRMKNGKVLISGGSDGGLGSNYNCLIFNPNDNNLIIGPAAKARIGHTLAEGDDGRIYIIGGTSGFGFNYVDQIEIYDPDSGTVSLGPRLQLSRDYSCVNRLSDGNFLISGSPLFSMDEWISYTTEILNPKTSTIEMGPNMMFGRHFGCSITTKSGRILVFPTWIHGSYEELDVLTRTFKVLAGTDIGTAAIAAWEMSSGSICVLFSKDGQLMTEIL